MSAPPHIVDYEPAQRMPWYRRAFVRRWICLSIIFLTTISVGLIGATTAYRLVLFRRSAAYEPGANQPAFPVQAGQSITPACWTALANEMALRSNGPVAFLHERTSPSGTHRLVCVEAMPYILSASAVLFQASVIAGPTAFSRSALIATSNYEVPVKDFTELSISAGQPDTNDPSHFTIAVKSRSGQLLLDGWLRDDDSVVIEERK